MDNFGKKLKLKENKKSILKRENEILEKILSMYEKCWDISNKVNSEYGVELIVYEEKYFKLIEELIYAKYESWKADIILWYVYGRKNQEGNILPLILEEEEKTSELYIKTPSDLINFLNDLERK